VRGVVGDGMDPAVAVAFAAAFSVGIERGAVLVGHDGRATAGVFEPAVISALLGSGRDVWRAGAVSTPTLGTLVRDYSAAGGIQISASHNPVEYNGLKMFGPDGTVLGAGAACGVVERFERGEMSWSRWDGVGRLREVPSPEERHLARVLSLVDVDGIRRHALKVVLDSCHGAGGRMGVELLRERLGCDVWHLGSVADGRYEHGPEPVEENLTAVGRVVSAVGADVGFVQDPDADRLAIIDASGRYIGEELTLALAVMRRLGQFRGPLAINLSTSRVSEELARRLGCEVVRAPVGEIHVVEAMRATGAALGGEGNGGVIDPRVGFVRDSFVGMALVLDLISAMGQPISELVEKMPRYVMIKRKIANDGRSGEGLVDRIRAAAGDAEIDTRDGVRVDWADGWVHIRPSNTEPVVRVIAEAGDAARAEELAAWAGEILAL
jgi:phosphomannomutase